MRAVKRHATRPLPGCGNARPSEGAEGANALGLKNAKPVPRDIFGFAKTGPRAIARGRGGD